MQFLVVMCQEQRGAVAVMGFVTAGVYALYGLLR